ncbi:NAD(P)-dependent oxidoreductase [Streptomyces sp. NPDC057253]|uniref:NAD(P)-dependent oxidoreductase n=1 Tax=Streptomyces sp. NPDC057253 TaxID=3346069 RepID=UPI00362FEDB6
MRDLAARSDVLVVAVRGSLDGEPFLPTLVPALLKAATEGGARIGVVGGAGSLHVAEGGPRVIDVAEVPAFVKAEMTAHAQTLKAPRAADTDVDWFCLSPAAEFGAHVPGERVGTFRLGARVMLSDADGRSFVSGADYALAFVDEIDKAAHHQGRLCVAY